MVTKVDRQDTNPVTKCAYLKEVLIYHVQKLIDGLPFMLKGYARAKWIVLGKFGKPVIVENAHIRCTTSSLVIKGSIPILYIISKKKLSLIVQALDTMKKVGEINGYVRMTLVDKLSDIRVDLVRLDDDWQD